MRATRSSRSTESLRERTLPTVSYWSDLVTSNGRFVPDCGLLARSTRVTLACLVALIVGLACGCGSVTGAPPGTQCFSAIDCAAGLVCVPKGSIRVCSSNLAAIETEIDAGSDGPAAAGDGSAASPAPSDATTMSTSDASSAVDSGSAPSSDAQGG
jgi:hypothetical protein